MLVVDKPAGITSFDVVRQVRRALGIKKVGHTGTLDPLATGVLPLCLGQATKIAGLLTADDKAYHGTGLLGLQTDTLDLEGQEVARADPSGVTRDQLEQALAGLRGAQQQVPPAFSAIRQGGQRAYKLARRGEQVDLPPRSVTIHRLELAGWQPPRFELEVACSKGTYIRSLVRDIGQQLGCGATLAALRRVSSGSFTLDQAVPLDRVEPDFQDGRLPLLSMDQALEHLPAVELDPEDAARLRQGQPVDPGPLPEAELLRVRCDGALVALGHEREGRLWPRRVFGGGG